MKKILITDYVHPTMPKALREKGFEVDDKQGIPLEEMFRIIDAYQGIVFNSRVKIDRHLLDLGKNLEFVARLGSGLEIVDIDLCKERGVEVFSSPAGNALAVAEHALGMLLAVSNNLIQANEEVKKFEWNREKNRGFEISGKTIGIIGFGNNGKRFAELIRGFEMEILAYDIIPEKVDNSIARFTSLEELQAQSDIISLHIPLTKETLQLINSEFIDRCKNGFILINTSRGPIVHTKDLITGLQEGKVSHACLDVFENEKTQTYTEEETRMYKQLFALQNVIVSPHIAGWTKQSLYRIAHILTESIINHYRKLEI